MRCHGLAFTILNNSTFLTLNNEDEGNDIVIISFVIRLRSWSRKFNYFSESKDISNGV
jgi:hypothetical protein